MRRGVLRRKILYSGAWNADVWLHLFPMSLADRSFDSDGNCVCVWNLPVRTVDPQDSGMERTTTETRATSLHSGKNAEKKKYLERFSQHPALPGSQLKFSDSSWTMTRLPSTSSRSPQA